MKIGAFTLSLAIVLAARAAIARPSARLSVERGIGAETCRGADALRQEVIERMGYEALRADAAESIDVAFNWRQGEGFSARVARRDIRGVPAGERVLTDEGSDCAALGDAVVLMISVLLESTSLPARSEPVSQRAAESSAESPPPSAHDTLKPRFRAEGTAAVGVAPAPAAGLSLSAGVRRGPLSLDLEGHADAPADGSFPGGRVRTSVRMAEIVPCGHVGLFAGCAVAGVGAIAIEGLDVTNARSDTRFHATGGLRLGIEPELGRGFFFSAHADALMVFTRTTAGVGARDVFTTSPFAASFAAGAGYAFP